MSTLRKLQPFDLRNLLEEGRDGDVLRFIMASVNDERGASDGVQIIDNRPGLNRAGDIELGGAVPK